MSKMAGWKRTQDGWTEEPCTVQLPLPDGLREPATVWPCQKTVPTRHGRARPHKDHWWEGKIAGRPCSIAWKE